MFKFALNCILDILFQVDILNLFIYKLFDIFCNIGFGDILLHILHIVLHIVHIILHIFLTHSAY